MPSYLASIQFHTITKTDSELNFAPNWSSQTHRFHVTYLLKPLTDYIYMLVLLTHKTLPRNSNCSPMSSPLISCTPDSKRKVNHFFTVAIFLLFTISFVSLPLSFHLSIIIYPFDIRNPSTFVNHCFHYHQLYSHILL